MKKFAKGLFVLLFAVVLATFAISCASTDNVDAQKTEKAGKQKKVKFDQVAYDEAFVNGDYATCISMLANRKDNDDIIKDQLDTNMLQYFLADYEVSGKSFFETQGQMQQMNADMTAAKVVGAALGGEKNVNYSGAIYERLLTYSMRIVNSMAAGKMDEAQGVVNTYVGDYRDIIAPLVLQQREIAAESEGVLDDPKVSSSIAILGGFVSLDIANLKEGIPPKSDVMYETSAFLSYLGTLVYAANNDPDHAVDFASVMKTKLPDFDVTEDITIPAGKGRLNVLSLAGTIGKRADSNIPKVVLFTMGQNYGKEIPVYFKPSYPIFDPAAQNHAIKSVRVKLSNGDVKDSVIIENFDEAVAIDVASKARGAFNRSIFRNIVKTAGIIPTTIAALEGVEKAKSASPIAGIAAEVAMQAAIAGIGAIADAEVADTRQGSYFPNFASSAGFTVDPGTYTVTVEYLNDDTIVDTKVFENVVVEEGKLSIKVSSCEK